MKKSFTGFLVCTFLFSFASATFARDKGDYSEVPKSSKPGTMSMWIEWIKDKGDKYDYRLHLENDSPNKDLLIRVNHIECYRDGKRGVTKNSYLKLASMSIPLFPGQKLDFNSFCYFNEETKGDFKIVIRNVYDNPTKDGITAGKVVVSDLTWSSPKIKR